MSQDEKTMLAELPDILYIILLAVERGCEKTLSEDRLTRAVQIWFNRILFVAFAESRGLIELQNQHPQMRLSQIAKTSEQPSNAFERIMMALYEQGIFAEECEEKLELVMTDQETVALCQKIMFPKGEKLDYGKLDPSALGNIYQNILEWKACRAEQPLILLRGNSSQPYPDPLSIELFLKSTDSQRVLILQKRTGLKRAFLRGLLAQITDRNNHKEVRSVLTSLAYSKRVIEEGELFIWFASARGQMGAHYTPMDLARRVVRYTLGPVLNATGAPQELLALRVCDPSMGGGVFLLATLEILSMHLQNMWDECKEDVVEEKSLADRRCGRR